ncbi:Uncharacterised protein [Klebsiella pneumoniae]|nr:Uncharacterised protein [Klebsiella pneumoniae]
MGFKPFLKQLGRRFALIAVGIEIMHLTRIVLPGFTEALFTQEAHRQLRQRAEIEHRFARKRPQLSCEHLGVILVSANHAGEVLAIEGAVEGDNRKRVVSPALIKWMLRRQRSRDNDSVHLALQQMLDAAHLVIGLILRAGNQQLIAALTRLTFEIICNPGIAGVFQIRDHQTDRACASCTQASSDRIWVIVVLSHHSHHFFDRFIAYAVLLRFAINHIARGGS